MLIPWASVPPKFRKMPEIRSQYLLVEPIGFNRIRVIDPFSKSEHVGDFYDGLFFCTCKAAEFRATCAHKLAALLYTQNLTQKELEMTNGSAVSLAPEPVSGGAFEPKQPVVLEDGFYAMFLSSFSAPKLYDGFNGGPQERKTFIKFLVTHGINERVLPRFTIATCFTSLKWFYSEQNTMESKYFSIYHAILSRKYTKAQLMALPVSELPNLDELVGKPLIGEIKMPNTPDKYGIYTPQVKGFKPVSQTMARELVKTFEQIEIKISQNTNFPYIASPKPEYQNMITDRDPQDEAAKTVSKNEEKYDYSDVNLDDIPF